MQHKSGEDITVIINKALRITAQKAFTLQTAIKIFNELCIAVKQSGVQNGQAFRVFNTDSDMP